MRVYIYSLVLDRDGCIEYGFDIERYVILKQSKKSYNKKKIIQLLHFFNHYRIQLSNDMVMCTILEHLCK